MKYRDCTLANFCHNSILAFIFYWQDCSKAAVPAYVIDISHFSCSLSTNWSRIVHTSTVHCMFLFIFSKFCTVSEIFQFVWWWSPIDFELRASTLHLSFSGLVAELPHAHLFLLCWRFWVQVYIVYYRSTDFSEMIFSPYNLRQKTVNTFPCTKLFHTAERQLSYNKVNIPE